MMRLLYTNRVPILSYGAQVKSFSYSDSREVNVAINDCIRKIFGFNRWMSIRDLRRQMGYRSIEEVFSMLSQRFKTKTCQSGNSVTRFLADQISSN